jgi:hypothetical protein
VSSPATETKGGGRKSEVNAGGWRARRLGQGGGAGFRRPAALLRKLGGDLGQGRAARRCPLEGRRRACHRPMAAVLWPCRPWPTWPDGLGRAGWPQGRGAERVRAGRAHGLGPNR